MWISNTTDRYGARPPDCLAILTDAVLVDPLASVQVLERMEVSTGVAGGWGDLRGTGQAAAPGSCAGTGRRGRGTEAQTCCAARLWTRLCWENYGVKQFRAE